MAKSKTTKKKPPKRKPKPRSAVAEFNYDGANTDTKRKQPLLRLKSTDQILTPTARKRLTSNTRDLMQNFSLAAWAVRRHLDYVSSFSFQPRTGDDELDTTLVALMKWYSRAPHSDVAARHSLPRLVRMAEERRVVDGDVFIIKMSSGHLQVIEGDRVRNPSQTDSSQHDGYVHGVKATKGGRMSSIAVHTRTSGGGYEFERIVRSANVFHIGYYDRFDQVRGVSPLAPAINAFRDVMEASEYALAKMKVAQLFGLVFYRENPDDFGETASGDESGYDVNFGSGPVKLDLDPGDKAEFLESKSPPAEFQQFMQTAISVALKSLDLPFSFYDESFTNFFGSRAALLHYEKACKSKRAGLQELLDRITLWRLGLFISDGDLELPGGMQLRDVDWEWVHDGTPWWDPSKEVNGDILAINAGLKTRSQVIKERHGRDFRTVIDQLAREEEYIQASGVSSLAPEPVDIPDSEEEQEDASAD